MNFWVGKENIYNARFKKKINEIKWKIDKYVELFYIINISPLQHHS